MLHSFFYNIYSVDEVMEEQLGALAEFTSSDVCSRAEVDLEKSYPKVYGRLSARWRRGLRGDFVFSRNTDKKAEEITALKYMVERLRKYSEIERKIVLREESEEERAERRRAKRLKAEKFVDEVFNYE